MKQRTPRNILLGFQLAVIAAVLVSGCDNVESKRPWKLESVGGPLEVRPLPPLSQIVSDYESWIRAGVGPRVLLYEVTLTNTAAQINYTNRVHLTDSPLGQSWITMTSFQYVFSSNEVAKFNSASSGKRDAGYLRVGVKPLKLYIEPLNLGKTPIPEFGITAVEGMPRGPIPASVPASASVP